MPAQPVSPMHSDRTKAGVTPDRGNARSPGFLRRIIRAAAGVVGTLLILIVMPGASCVGDSTVSRSTPGPTQAPTATPAAMPTATPSPTEAASATTTANAQASAQWTQVAEAAIVESEPQREGDWEVRVREAVRVPELLGKSPTTGDFVVVVFAATHMDEGQGRLDKATFELHELRGDRIAVHDERLSDHAAANLDLPLLGASVPEGSTAEFAVVFANVATPSNRLVFRFDSNRFLVGSISFHLSQILGESPTSRLVALPRQETTSATAAALTPTSEPTLTPTPDPTPTSTPAPASTPTPTLKPTPTAIPTPTPIPRNVAALARCQPVPEALIAKLNSGLTIDGGGSVSQVRVVENNDDRPWSFIAGKLDGPGMDGVTAVWATVSLDLNEDTLLVAAEFIAAEFSVWDFPDGGQSRFADKFDDDIALVKQCVEST